jgi:hypothetical protein
MSIRVTALSPASLRSEPVVIAPASRLSRIVPVPLSREAAEARMSPSEKIVSGIAVGVLMAGFATAMLEHSAARSFHPQTLSRTSNTPQIGGTDERFYHHYFSTPGELP